MRRTLRQLQELAKHKSLDTLKGGSEWQKENNLGHFFSQIMLKKTEDIIFPVEGALLNFFLLNDVIFCHSIHILYSGLKDKPMSHHLSQYSISTAVFHFVLMMEKLWLLFSLLFLCMSVNIL